MNDRNLVRGLFLIAIALAFGLGSLRYPIGDFARAGPALFPLLVSSLLGLIGVTTVIRSRFVERVPLGFSLKNIALVLASLAGFAVVSGHLNMILGIIVMVFTAAFAHRSAYSVVRNVKVCIGLILIAVAFRELLGLNLPLY